MIDTKADVKPSQMEFECDNRETSALSCKPRLIATAPLSRSALVLCSEICFSATCKLNPLFSLSLDRSGPVTSWAPSLWAYGLERRGSGASLSLCRGSQSKGARDVMTPRRLRPQLSRYAYLVCALAHLGHDEAATNHASHMKR